MAVETQARAPGGGVVKITIRYICTECFSHEALVLLKADIDNGGKKFECSDCGFKNEIRISGEDPTTGPGPVKQPAPSS